MSTDDSHDAVPEFGQRDGDSGGRSDRQRGSNRQTLEDLEDAAGELARAMGLPAPRGQAQREALSLAARRALDAPDLAGVNLKAPEWASHRPELDELLSAGTALSKVRVSPDAQTVHQTVLSSPRK